MAKGFDVRLSKSVVGACNRGESSIQIRVLAASSPEDYLLAIKLTHAFATITRSDITPEDENEMNLASFNERYNDQWAKDHCEQMVSAVFKHQLADNKTLKLSGVKAHMELGDRMMAQLMKDPTAAAHGFF